jgi:hypothetical protein
MVNLDLHSMSAMAWWQQTRTTFSSLAIQESLQSLLTVMAPNIFATWLRFMIAKYVFRIQVSTVHRSHDNFKFRDFHPEPGIRVLLADI